jgi:hypothetical protein
MIWKLLAGLFGLSIAISVLTGWDFIGSFIYALDTPTVAVAATIAFLFYFIQNEDEL